jgi:hypothetical protein
MSKNKYPSLISKVQEISEDKKAGVNQSKAKLVLEKIKK